MLVVPALFPRCLWILYIVKARFCYANLQRWEMMMFISVELGKNSKNIAGLNLLWIRIIARKLENVEPRLNY